jgi:cysteine-rich repeat protein
MVTLTGMPSENSVSSTNVDLIINNVASRASVTRFFFLQEQTIIEFMVPIIFTNQNVSGSLSIHHAETPHLKAVVPVFVFASLRVAATLAKSLHPNASSVVVKLTNVPYSPTSLFFTIICLDPSVIFGSSMTSSNSDTSIINISISVWTSMRKAKFVFTHLPSQASVAFDIAYFLDNNLIFEKVEPDIVLCDFSNQILFKTTGQFVSINEIVSTTSRGTTFTFQNYVPSTASSGFLMGSFRTPSCALPLDEYSIQLTTSNKSTNFLFKVLSTYQLKISALIPNSGPLNGFSVSVVLVGSCETSNLTVRVGEKLVIPTSKSGSENRKILISFIAPRVYFAVPQPVVVQCAGSQATDTLRYYEICAYPEFCLKMGLFASRKTFQREDEMCNPSFCIDQASIPSPIVIFGSLKSIGDIDAWFLIVKDIVASKSSDIRIVCNQDMMVIYSSKIDAGFFTELYVSTPSEAESSFAACRIFSIYYGQQISSSFEMKLRKKVLPYLDYIFPSNKILTSLNSSFICSFGNFFTEDVKLTSNMNVSSRLKVISSNFSQNGFLVVHFDIFVTNVSANDIKLTFSASSSISTSLLLQIINLSCTIQGVYPAVQTTGTIFSSEVILRYSALKEDAYLSYNNVNTLIIVPASTSSEIASLSFVHNLSIYNVSLLRSLHRVYARLVSMKNLIPLTEPIFAFEISSPIEPRVISKQPVRIFINVRSRIIIETVNFIPKLLLQSDSESPLDFKTLSSCNILRCEVDLELILSSCRGLSIVMFDSLTGGSKLTVNVSASPPASVSSPSSFHLGSTIVLKITSYCTFHPLKSHNFRAFLGDEEGNILSVSFGDEICQGCSSIVTSIFRTDSKSFEAGKTYTSSIWSANFTDSASVRILPSVRMLFSTNIPQIEIIDGVLQESLHLVFVGLPFSLQKEDNCYQSKISLNYFFIEDSPRLCSSNSMTINLLAFNSSLLMNSQTTTIRFQMNHFGDLFQSQAAAVLITKNALKVSIISNIIDVSHASDANRGLTVSVSSLTSSMLLSALNVRIDQSFLPFSLVYSQGFDSVIRIIIPIATHVGRVELVFTAFSQTETLEVVLKPVIEYNCVVPCYKTLTGGILILNVSTSSSVFNDISDFFVTMQNQFLKVTSFTTANGTLSILVPPIPLNMIIDANNMGQIFPAIHVQHSKLTRVEFDVNDFYYQSPVYVASCKFDLSGSRISVTFNQQVASDLIYCKLWFQNTTKLGKGWTCLTDSKFAITLMLGTQASIVPGDILSIIAGQLRPINHRESFFKNSEMAFSVTAPADFESMNVDLQGSTVMDPCSSVVITALFESPRELIYNWSCSNDAKLSFAISRERYAAIRIVPSMLETSGKTYIILVSVTNFLGMSWYSMPFELFFDSTESLKISILPLHKAKFEFTDNIEITSIVQFSSCKSSKNDISFRWSIKNLTANTNIAEILASVSGPRLFLPANLFVPNSPNVLTVAAFGGIVSAYSTVVVWVSPPALPAVEILNCVATASISQTLELPIFIFPSSMKVKKIMLLCSTEDSQKCRNSLGVPLNFNISSTNLDLVFAAYTFQTPVVAIFTAEIVFQHRIDVARAACTISFVTGNAIPTVTIKKIPAAQIIDPRLPFLAEALFDTQNYKCTWEETSGFITNIASYTDPQIGFKRQSLLILGNTLMPGLTYQFKVSLIKGSQIFATANISIRTNAAPTQGGCRIIYNEDTTTTLMCSKWIDEDLPLLYRFGFRSSSTNVSMEHSRIPFFTFSTFGSEMTVTASVCDILLLCSSAFEFFVKSTQTSPLTLSEELNSAKKLSSINDILSLGLVFSSSLQNPSNSSKSRMLLQEDTRNSLFSILKAAAGALQLDSISLSFQSTAFVLSSLNYVTRTSKLMCDDACLDVAVTVLEKIVNIGRFDFRQSDVCSTSLDCIGSLLDISVMGASRIATVGQRISTMSDFFKIAINKAVSESMINDQTPQISGSHDSFKVVTFRVTSSPGVGRSFVSTPDTKNRAATFHLSPTILLLNSSSGIIAVSIDVQEIPWKNSQFFNNSESIYILNSLYGLRFSQHLSSRNFSSSILVSLNFESETVPYDETLWRTKLKVSSWKNVFSNGSGARSFSRNECSVVNVSRFQGKNSIFALCNDVNAIGIEVDPKATLCGNGYLESLEQCDDGNVLPFDGCDENCRVENNWKCFRTGTFNIQEFNPDTCRFIDVPYLFCPKGYFGSSCDIFILPQSVQKFEISSLVDNSLALLVGNSTLKIYIPANASKSNISLTVRVYSSSKISEKPAAELSENLHFSELVFLVEPYLSFFSEIQVEFTSANIFVNSTSNASKTNNFLNPSSIAAYQQTEAFCASRSSCQFQIGSLGSKMGTWAPFRYQKTNASSFQVFFRTKELSKFSFMMTTAVVVSVTPSRGLFDLPQWALILFVCSAVVLSASVGLILWRRLRAHDSQVLQKLAQKYSVTVDTLNSPETVKLSQNLDVKRSSLYVVEESFSDETVSSVGMPQFSDEDSQSSDSQEISRKSSLQQKTNGSMLTKETRILNEDVGKMPYVRSNMESCQETFNWKSLKSAQPTEEELDLEFLMEMNTNPEVDLDIDFDENAFRAQHLTPATGAKTSVTYEEVGTPKIAGSLVLSPRVAEEMKVSRTFLRMITSTNVRDSEPSLPKKKEYEVKQSKVFARPSKPLAQKLTSDHYTSDEKTHIDASVELVASKLTNILQVTPSNPQLLDKKSAQIDSEFKNSTPRLSQNFDRDSAHGIEGLKEYTPRRIPQHVVSAVQSQLDGLDSSHRLHSARSNYSEDIPQSGSVISTRNTLAEQLFPSNHTLIGSQSERAIRNNKALPFLSLTRMAPQLIRPEKPHNIVDDANSSHSATLSRTHDDVNTSIITPWTLRSKLYPSVVKRSDSGEMGLPIHDQTTTLASTKALVVQYKDGMPLNTSELSSAAVETVSKKSTSLQSPESDIAAADQSMLVLLGLSMPSSASTKKESSPLQSTPRPAASNASSVSVAPTRFSYKKPNIVKDPRGRH